MSQGDHKNKKNDTLTYFKNKLWFVDSRARYK